METYLYIQTIEGNSCVEGIIEGNTKKNLQYTEIIPTITIKKDEICQESVLDTSSVVLHSNGGGFFQSVLRAMAVHSSNQVCTVMAMHSSNQFCTAMKAHSSNQFCPQ